MIRNNKGMTLLEIMIVLVILGGLIAILATQVQGRLKKAKIGQAQIQISELGKALDMYFSDCSNYPSTEEGLEGLMTATQSCGANWGPDPYLKKLKKTDPWNGDFVYESTGNVYTLKSLGSDKREGGSGDAADISSDQ
jgi:general secretion pathway protein G